MNVEIKNKTYSSVQDEMDSLNISLKEKLISWILAILCSFLVVCGPIAFFINMLIFANFIKLYAFLIALSILCFFFLSDFLYLKNITKGKIQGLYHVYAIDGFVITIFVLVAYLFINLIGVI